MVNFESKNGLKWVIFRPKSREVFTFGPKRGRFWGPRFWDGPGLSGLVSEARAGRGKIFSGIFQKNFFESRLDELRSIHFLVNFRGKIFSNRENFSFEKFSHDCLAVVPIFRKPKN